MNRTTQVTRPIVSIFMTVFLITGVVGAAMAESEEEEQLRQAAYQKLMEIVLGEKIAVSFGEGGGKVVGRVGGINNYRKIRDSKVLSVCIFWHGNSVDELRMASWASTSAERLGMGRLRRENLSNCQSFAKGNGQECKCQIVDENDKNKLELPEDWKARALAK